MSCSSPQREREREKERAYLTAEHIALLPACFYVYVTRFVGGAASLQATTIETFQVCLLGGAKLGCRGSVFDVGFFGRV